MVTEKDKDDFYKLLDFEATHADLEDDEYFDAKRKWLKSSVMKIKEDKVSCVLGKLWDIFKKD